MKKDFCRWCGKEVTDSGFPPHSKERQPFCHNCDEYVPTETRNIPEPKPLMRFSDRMALEEAFCNWAKENGVAQIPMNVAAFIDIHPEWLEKFTMLKEMRARQKRAEELVTPDDGKLRLTLHFDVNYDLGGESADYIKRSLEQLAHRAVGEGLLTGASEATVDDWKASVFERQFNVNGEELSDNDRAELERCRREVYQEEFEKLKKEFEASKGVLSREGTEPNDYVMKEETGAWIRHKNLVAYVRASDDGLAVDITPHVCADETLDVAFSSFDEAKNYECKTCGQYTGGIDEKFCEECEKGGD
jgi:hypothetical protein